MTWNNLRRSFERLSDCHAGLRSAFATLDDATLALFFGAELDCPSLREQIREHGDGYTVQLRVANVESLRDVDAVVLFAVTSPKLDRDSVFDGRPLHEIPYWRERRRLRPVVQVANLRCRLLFLSWQQNSSVHGKDDSHAERNLKLLRKNAGFYPWLEQEPRLAREYIRALGAWCRATGRPFLLLRHHQRSLDRLDEALLELVRNRTAKCICTQLRGTNYKIMKRHIPDALACYANAKVGGARPTGGQAEIDQGMGR